jgi:AcrR family transcriptional regulator
MSTSEHGSRRSSECDDREPEAGQAIAPIYKRLPKGPHGITAPEVAHHQRIRMHGAMIEAVATRGYENTSVKHVIGLAGVSRRAFYEQFANKEDCFMETFDLIVNRGIKRINQAYRSTAGSSEQRLRTAFGAFVEEVQLNSKALHLVVIDAQIAGPEGLQRLQRTTGMFEGLLSNAFSDPRSPDALPLPIVRAIVGGLRRATFMRLRDGHPQGLKGLTEEMLRWSLLFKSPAVGELRPRPCSNPPFPRLLELEPAPGEEDDYARLLRSAIDLALRERMGELSSLRIADEAGVAIETFLALFGDTRTCYLAALDMLGGELLQLVADPGLVSTEWSAAVCRTIDSLLRHLASNPALASTLATRVFDAGPRAIENVGDLAHEVATLLTEGAPRRPRSKLAVEGVAGALWHTLCGEVAAGRGHRLPVLTEYLSYVVLSPFVGPDEAVRAIVDSRLATPPAPAGAPLREVSEHGADEQGDHDHDDQGSAPGVKDPVDLNVFEVEDGEQGRKHRQRHQPAGARQLAVTATLRAAPGLGGGGGHPTLDATYPVSEKGRRARTGPRDT